MRVQLFSGGMDSLCLWALAERPQPVYVRVGAPYEREELETLAALERAVHGFVPWILDGPPVARSPRADGHVLHRNLVLLTTAASLAGGDELLLGALLGEASPDKSRRFRRAVTAALTASEGRPCRVVTPAARMTKTGLLARALVAHPWVATVLPLTRSCYRPAGPPCDACPACFRRAVAEFHTGLRDARPSRPSATARQAWRAARTAGVGRWPALAVNNTTAALALAGYRLHPDVAKEWHP